MITKQWIAKNIFISDLLDKGLTEYILYIIMFFLSNLMLTAYIGYTNIAPYAYNFSHLTRLDGIINVHSYNYVHGQSNINTPVIDVFVESNNTKVSYCQSQLDANDQLFQKQNSINHQKVQVWYLPQNNQFYLINFLENKDLNNLDAAKYSKSELLNHVFFIKLVLPAFLIMLQLMVWAVQLHFMKQLVIRNYNRYKLEDRYKEKSMQKGYVVFSRPKLANFLLAWPILLILIATQIFINSH